MANTDVTGSISDAEILAQVPAARRRESRARAAGRRATSARYDAATHRIVVELSNGFLFGCPVDAVPALADATPAQLAAVELSPAGSGLHWEALDVDLSVAGLVLSALGRSRQQRELARLVGRVTKPAKAAAARVNGVEGKRPRRNAS